MANRIETGLKLKGLTSDTYTLDVTGNTITYGDAEISGKTKTTTLQVTSGATAGYILTALDSNGNASWEPQISSNNVWTTGSTGTYSIKAINDTTTDATNDYAVAEGSATTATARYSHAEGVGTTAGGDGSHAEGYLTRTSGYYSHAEGQSTWTQGFNSHAEGQNTIAVGNNSHAEGQSTTAIKAASHSEGANTIASGTSSHAEGQATKALGDYTHAEGYLTTASGTSSHAEGYTTTASGDYSHAEGYQTTAIGFFSHAEGGGTIASGTSAHAEGNFTKALGTYSHAEGSNTTAVGNFSHAEGSVTTAAGQNSHAGGDSSKAIGNYSFVHGFNSVANGTYTTVFGNNITGNTNDMLYVNNIAILSGASNGYLLVSDASGNTSWKPVSTATSGLTDVRVTGATYSNNTFTYTNNTGGTFNVLFNTVTGLTVNGDLTVTGNTSVKGITGTTISGTSLNVNNIAILSGASNGYILTSDALGNASWKAVSAATSGGTGSKTVQIGASNPLAVSSVNNTVYGVSGSFLPQIPYYVQQNTGSGAGSMNLHYQFVIPAGYVGPGTLRITTRRNFASAISTATATLYIDGVVSNINGLSCYPSASNVWESFSLPLTSTTTAGTSSIIVVITPTITISNGLFYIRDLTFNHF